MMHCYCDAVVIVGCFRHPLTSGKVVVGSDLQTRSSSVVSDDPATALSVLEQGSGTAPSARSCCSCSMFWTSIENPSCAAVNADIELVLIIVFLTKHGAKWSTEWGDRKAG